MWSITPILIHLKAHFVDFEPSKKAADNSHTELASGTGFAKNEREQASVSNDYIGS